MPTQRTHIRHTSAGGWATDYGPTAEVSVEGNRVQIPFWVNAENGFWELDGGFRKMGGMSKLNSVAVTGSTTVMGLTDFWQHSDAGSPTQKRVCHANTRIFKEDADGTFDVLKTGLVKGAIPCYRTFEDKLIISSNAGADVPQLYTQPTTIADLGTPSANCPNFAFCEPHKNRIWAAGVDALPSRLYYSPELTSGGANGNWNDITSGTIDISPNDGDRITALASHKNELWVFKGPNRGSIHRITGSAPTGQDGFARVTFIEGLGAVGHNSIFRFKDDIGFMAPDGAVHSLKATAAYGDFNESSLSRPINTWLREHVNTSRLEYAWSVTDDARGRVLITIAVDSSTTNNRILAMDFRFDPVRWSLLPAVSAGCLAMSIDQGGDNIPTVMAGGHSGFVRKMDRLNRNIDGTTAISSKLTSPFMSYGTPKNMKTIYEASVGVQPRGDYDLTFGWTRDNMAQQTTGISQGGGDVLAGGLTTGSISSFADGGAGKVTVNSNAHGLSDGTRVAIYNDSVTATRYQGEYTVADAAADSFTIAIDWVDDDSDSAKWGVSTTSNYFILGVSTLGGALFVDRHAVLDEGGEFRSIQYKMSNNGLNEDLEVHSFTATIKPGADSSEN